MFDLPGLRDVLGQLRDRHWVVTVDTAKASPFAQSLLFNWIAAHVRRRCTVGRATLRPCRSTRPVARLLAPKSARTARPRWPDVELELQCIADSRRARSPDELHDVRGRRSHDGRGRLM
jgi:hypothetical protein